MRFNIKIKFLVLLAITAMFSLLPSYSQNSVNFSDTAISRETVTEYYIYGTFDKSLNISKINLVFGFNGRVIDIKGAYGNKNYFMNEDTLWFKKEYPKQAIRDKDTVLRIDSAIIEIASEKINNIGNGLICILKMKGLVDSTSMTALSLKEIYINSELRNDVLLTSRIITVKGDKYYPLLNFSLGEFYPNPCILKTNVNFSIGLPSNVKFTIYDNAGQFISSSENSPSSDYFIVEKLDKAGNVDNINGLFEPGNYRLKINPIFWDTHIGLYYLVMQTDFGAFKSSFIYFRK